MQKLVAIAIKQAKTDDKPYSLVDGGGLYILIKPQGKYWRYNYRFEGKQKTLALGVYPIISLSDARKAHQTAREQIASGIDPAELKRTKKISTHLASDDSFEATAIEWFGQRMLDKSDSHKKRTKRILEKDLFPSLGRRPISNITAQELLLVLKKIESRSVDMAHRAKQTAGLVLRYAIASARTERDVSQDLLGALRLKSTTHLAAITNPSEVGILMDAIDGYKGTLVVKTALSLSAMLFQRPGEIRHMEWVEINWDESRWEIPASKMKMKSDHIVPLSTQARTLLSELFKLTGRGKYVFPSARGGSRPLSENGVRTALRAMGYDNNTMTPHGFRAMARTILDEVLGFRSDIIEHQLAHAVKDPNGRAYNRTTHLEVRQKMMQSWADYLDILRLAHLSSGNTKFTVRAKNPDSSSVAQLI
jgi:integrase